jgi:hypothetical protein
MKYEEAVQKNLDHMGTPASDWKAVAIKSMAETTDDKGRKIKMPEFDFPKDYTHAPSLFLSGTSDTCCELCGTAIKFVYWLQNDTRKWLLCVGSECVTQFEQASGLQLSKEFMWEQNRQLLRECIAARHEIFAHYSRKDHMGYGRYRNIIVNKQAHDTWRELDNLIGDKDADGRWPTTDGAITRWVNAYGEQARELLDTAQDLIKRTAIQPAA